MLYTQEERYKRDKTRWTLVQGVLAPLQFIVFLVSLGLLLNYLVNETFLELALISVVLKTLILCLIMVTGAMWEKTVFGQYLFANAFYWEDVVSMVVVFLHLIYLVAYFFNLFSVEIQLFIALAAYAAYVVNAIQFLVKFRLARIESSRQVLMEGVS